MILTVVIMATGIGPLALNTPLPSMPGMADYFDAPYSVVQLVLTLYLAALAIAQLVYGPLSDRFGRRPVLIAGLGCFILGSLACAVAPTVETLLAARVVQGAGGCAGMVLGRAILRDLFERRRAASLLGYVTMAMVVAPMLGPAVGGVLDEWVGWRAGFALMALLGIGVGLLTIARLPETHTARTLAAGFGPLVQAGRVLVGRKDFLAFAAVLGFTSSVFFSFLAGAPFIVVELMDRSPAEYGLWFVIISVGFMFGSFLSGRYVERLGIKRMMRFGTMGNVLATAGLIGSMATAPYVPATLFVPMVLVAFSNGLVMPNSVAGAVSVRPDLAGAASGLAGSIQMSLAACVTVIVALLQGDSAAAMLSVMVVCAVLAAIGYVAVSRFDRAN